jgi:hypothetical protein
MREPLSIGLTAVVAAMIYSGAGFAVQPAPDAGHFFRLAQAPGDLPVSTRRTVNLNEQDRHTIREIVLKDPKLEKAPDNIKVSIGGPVPPNVHTNPMPDDVIRKVPQIKTNTFFVTGEEVVIVEPKDNTVAEIVK